MTREQYQTNWKDYYAVLGVHRTAEAEVVNSYEGDDMRNNPGRIDINGRSCPECHVEVGKLHRPGCDHEACPICGDQLLSCLCPDDIIAMLIKKIRVPWVYMPSRCALCGKQEPEYYMDDDWDKYVPHPLNEEILCLECYGEMKKLFPKGWKKCQANEPGNRLRMQDIV